MARPVCECFTDESTPFVPGKANIMREGGDVAIIAMGLMVAEALKAADLLAAEGIRATVVNMHTVKPLEMCIRDRYNNHRFHLQTGIVVVP